MPHILSCTFTAPGNPRYGEFAPVAPAEVCYSTRLADISAAAQAYIDRHGLGAGNWAAPAVYDDTGAEVGIVSYNGRVWPPKAWDCDAAPIYDPREGEG